MLTLTTLASGSSGNCLLLSAGETHLLVDAGISCRRICRSLRDLGVDPSALLGVLVTHEHTDHIAGLATLTKQFRLPVYASPGTGRHLCYRIAALEDVLHTCAPGGAFTVGGLAVETFPTLHDAAEPMGYAVSDGSRKAAVVTDLGVVTEAVLAGVAGADLLVVESNTTWTGSSPAPTPTPSSGASWVTTATCPTRRGPPWPAQPSGPAPAPSFWPTCPPKTTPPPAPGTQWP